jgi:hypothetical protein
MLDQYATLIKMTLEGKAAEEIASAVGWPADAVATIAEEVMCADNISAASFPADREED